MGNSLRELLAPLRALPVRLEQVRELDRVANAVYDAVKDILTPGSPLNETLSGTDLGHPLHPPLTDVVIGAWAAALAVDLVGGRRGQPAADRLIALGVWSALPTVATGLNDWTTLSGPTRRLGVLHGANNMVATAFFGASWIARKVRRRQLGRLLALAGFGSVSFGAFLGGHLSFRRGVGVDHTAFQNLPGDWTEVVDEAGVKESSPIVVQAAGVDIMLVRQKGSVYALVEHCAHQGGPLHQGKLEDGCVTCPWHSSRFRLADGAALSGPTAHPQPALQVRTHDGKIEVKAGDLAWLGLQQVTTAGEEWCVE